MTENRYSHDQKEKAFELVRNIYEENDWTFSFNNYQELYEKSQNTHIQSERDFARETHLEQLNEISRPFRPTIKTLIEHPLDVEYFKEFKAPLMELMHSAHYTNVNSTITFFGPMLYFLCRALGVEQVLEIGIAEGYTSWYLANAVKDNAVRYKMDGNMYYGLDILDRSQLVKPKLDAAGLPNKLIQMDSINLTRDTFKDVRFDMIFQDGAHDTEHVVHEINILYPQLKGQGNGFLLCHDVYGPAEEGVKAILNNKNYEWEYVRICEIYGIAILRKMEGYDHKKRFWVE